MIGYTTEIDLKNREVRTKFRNGTRTFQFAEHRDFGLLDAMKVSAEEMHGQVIDFLGEAAEWAERHASTGTLIHSRLRSMKHEAIRKFLLERGPTRLYDIARTLDLNAGCAYSYLRSGERHGLYRRNGKLWEAVPAKNEQ